jgi:pSer/pThr/pTyr-binding forkhead associated (FHA) protein
MPRRRPPSRHPRSPAPRRRHQQLRPPPSGGGSGELASTENATRLVITSGAKAGAEFPLGHDEITIGRSSDSAIIIRDDYTSTHHARIMLWNGRWMIQDLDSTNGTFLNGSRVTVPTPIPLGATVKVGATTFELRR